MKANLKKIYLVFLLCTVGVGYGLAQCPPYERIPGGTIEYETTLISQNTIGSIFGGHIIPMHTNGGYTAVYNIRNCVYDKSNTILVEVEIKGAACIYITGEYPIYKTELDSYYLEDVTRYRIYIRECEYWKYTVEVRYLPGGYNPGDFIAISVGKYIP